VLGFLQYWVPERGRCRRYECHHNTNLAQCHSIIPTHVRSACNIKPENSVSRSRRYALLGPKPKDKVAAAGTKVAARQVLRNIAQSIRRILRSTDGSNSESSAKRSCWWVLFGLKSKDEPATLDMNIAARPACARSCDRINARRLRGPS
jgi:hypothetical protein